MLGGLTREVERLLSSGSMGMASTATRRKNEWQQLLMNERRAVGKMQTMFVLLWQAWNTTPRAEDKLRLRVERHSGQGLDQDRVSWPNALLFVR
jgi:hypothetical protein